MATYQLTMDVGAGPWEQGISLRWDLDLCPEENLPFAESIYTVQDLAVAIIDLMIVRYPGSTASYTIDGTVITWTFNLDIDINECGNLVYGYIPDAYTIFGAFQYITPTACPTCQEVVIDNCGSVIFEAAVPNGTYEVQVQDHQSGVTYMQDIEFTGSQGTWDQTNTGGVFSPFSVYTVTILDAEGDPVSWIDGSNEYNCMRLTFKQFTDTTPA